MYPWKNCWLDTLGLTNCSPCSIELTCGIDYTTLSRKVKTENEVGSKYAHCDEKEQKPARIFRTEKPSGQSREKKRGRADRSTLSLITLGYCRGLCPNVCQGLCWDSSGYFFPF